MVRVSKVTVESVELRFPSPGGKVLSINDSYASNWQAKRRILEPWRDLVGWSWQMLPIRVRSTIINVPCTVHVTIPFLIRRGRDPHNYVGTVCKALVDQLVMQGVWPDDTPQWVTVVEPTLVKGSEVIVRLVPRP